MNTSYNKSAIVRIPQILGLCIITVLLAACGGGAATEEEGHEHGEEEGHDGSAFVTVSPQQFAAIEGKLALLEQKNLTTALKATGFLKVPPQNRADITAAMGGTVREVLVLVGEKVRKGQPLVTIADAAIIDLQRDYIDAKARLAYAKAELDRQTELAGANVSAQKTLQQATAEHGSLQAAVNGNAELLRLINIDPDKLASGELRSTATIVSPIEGTVADITVNVGSKVTGDAPMMRVVNNVHLHADLLLYERDLAKVKVGQTLDISVTNLPGRTCTGRIFAIGSAFENETRTIPIHADITSDKEGLIDGMGVSARVDLGQARTPAVLTEAIVAHAGNDYIFIRAEEQEEHGHGEEAGHEEETEHAHAEGEEHAERPGDDGNPAEEKKEALTGSEEREHGPGEAKEDAHEEEEEAHEAQAPDPGSMTFKRILVKRGTTDGAYSAVTFLEPVPADAEVVVGGAYYLIAIMTNAGEGDE